MGGTVTITCLKSDVLPEDNIGIELNSCQNFHIKLPEVQTDNKRKTIKIKIKFRAQMNNYVSICVGQRLTHIWLLCSPGLGVL